MSKFKPMKMSSFQKKDTDTKWRVFLDSVCEPFYGFPLEQVISGETQCNIDQLYRTAKEYYNELYIPLETTEHVFTWDKFEQVIAPYCAAEELDDKW